MSGRHTFTRHYKMLPEVFLAMCVFPEQHQGCEVWQVCVLVHRAQDSLYDRVGYLTQFKLSSRISFLVPWHDRLHFPRQKVLEEITKLLLGLAADVHPFSKTTHRGPVEYLLTKTMFVICARSRKGHLRLLSLLPTFPKSHYNVSFQTKAPRIKNTSCQKVCFWSGAN